MKILTNRTLPTDAKLEHFFESLPGRFDIEGELLYDGRNTIKRFDVKGLGSVVVKCFHRPALPQRFVYTFFRKSKAQRSFLHAEQLIARGFYTPQNIACIETKKLLLSHCYYVSRPLPADFKELRTGLPVYDDDPIPVDGNLADAFAQWATRLHEQGILHGDLNSTNVLWRAKVPLLQEGVGEVSHAVATAYDFCLIDLNRMRIYPPGKVPTMAECMENLTRFTGRMDVFSRVAHSYCRCRSLDETAMTQRMIAVKQSHDKRWRQRKSFTGWLKRLVRIH